MANAPSQYFVYYQGTVIETTGYINSLAAARAFVKRRYSDTAEMSVQPCYPKRGEITPVQTK